MNSPNDEVPVSQLVCRVDELNIGDLIWTPAHMWETVTRLDSGDEFSRSTRVATDETGPDHPREWSNQHRLIVEREEAASRPATVVPLRIPRPAALMPAAPLPSAA